MGVKVLLNSVDKVKDFIDITRSVSYDIDLISGRDNLSGCKIITWSFELRDCTEAIDIGYSCRNGRTKRTDGTS